ncbi:MAG TPA: hypothetical protein VKP30_14830 [Polyangiaceae bacterium]|nr:hypothetical protein [Polyangiaceae bacterium]
MKPILRRRGARMAHSSPRRTSTRMEHAGRTRRSLHVIITSGLMSLHVIITSGLMLVGLGSGCDRDAPTNQDSEAVSNEQRLDFAARSLIALDVPRAREALDGVSERSQDTDLLRARLAVMVGDCHGAVTLLTAHENQSTSVSAYANSSESPSELFSVAEGCSRAMAGAEIVSDEAAQVWVRLQNSRDRALVPLIAEVANRARKAISAHLRARLPGPIRIELVSDLASLSLVTGLPLEAAETTGTVAIARWGKITLLSPRATPQGYPWQDTLAHELAHLIVARQSSDAAPLWLQEGIAKREETRWREPLALDDDREAHREAKAALIEGRSIGIDRLGASMALLPTAKAADTAYAEVRDFLDYWLQETGEPALVLLLRDLAGMGANGVERALVSVSGYKLDDWILRWQRALQAEASPGDRMLSDVASSGHSEWTTDGSRRLRLAELLSEQKHHRQALEQLAPLISAPKLVPELATRAIASRLITREVSDLPRLIEPERVTHLDGTWLALRGRALESLGDAANAETAYRQSLAFAPTLERVACRGISEQETEPEPGPQPALEPWRALCLSARAFPR